MLAEYSRVLLCSFGRRIAKCLKAAAILFIGVQIRPAAGIVNGDGRDRVLMLFPEAAQTVLAAIGANGGDKRAADQRRMLSVAVEGREGDGRGRVRMRAADGQEGFFCDDRHIARHEEKGTARRKCGRADLNGSEHICRCVSPVINRKDRSGKIAVAKNCLDLLAAISEDDDDLAHAACQQRLDRIFKDRFAAQRQERLKTAHPAGKPRGNDQTADSMFHTLLHFTAMCALQLF